MGSVEEVLCAGDAIFGYRFSNAVLGRLREIGARMVLGNHELDVLGMQGERVREHHGTDPQLLRWLAEQPQRLDTVVNGHRLAMFHATPSAPYDYVYPASPRLLEFGEIGAEFVIYGHTHTALVRRIGHTVVINPGSAGEPRDHANGLRASYAVLDTQSGEVTIDVYDDPLYPPPLARAHPAAHRASTNSH